MSYLTRLLRRGEELARRQRAVKDENACLACGHSLTLHDDDYGDMGRSALCWECGPTRTHRVIQRAKEQP